MEDFTKRYSIGKQFLEEPVLSPCITEGNTIFSKSSIIGRLMKFYVIGTGKNFEDIVALKQQLEKLSDEDLGIIGLRAAGYTQVETAKVMGLSRTSVGTIERRVYATLRNSLDNNVT